MCRWFLVPLVCSLSVSSGYAADYAVSPGQSIASALRQMHAGDTLTIQAGVYDAHDLKPPSGVTIQGAPGQNVVIRPTGGPNHVFDVMTGGVTIRNLTLDGSAGGMSVGVWIEDGANRVEHVTITNPTSQGITLFCARG